MKNFITIFMIMLSVSAFSQNDCTLAYLGPASTADLQYILSNSKEPVLMNLDTGTQQSLITYSLFINGIFSGFSGSDANIQNLYNTNMDKVLSKILQTKVKIVSGPVCKEKNITLVPGGSNIPVAICSVCSNCIPPQSFPIGCCSVGGNGCCDYLNPKNDGLDCTK